MLRWLTLALGNYTAPDGYKWRLIYAGVPAAGDTLTLDIGGHFVDLISGAQTTCSGCLGTSTNNPIYTEIWIPGLAGNTFQYGYLTPSVTGTIILVDEVPDS